MNVHAPICLRAKNVGKPNEGLDIESKSLLEALTEVARWATQQHMTTRIDIMIGRRMSDLALLDSDPRVRRKHDDLNIDNLFDMSLFADSDPTAPEAP